MHSFTVDCDTNEEKVVVVVVVVVPVTSVEIIGSVSMLALSISTLLVNWSTATYNTKDAT